MDAKELYRKGGLPAVLAAVARAVMAGLAGTATDDSPLGTTPRAERMRVAAILKSAADGDDLIDPRLPACPDLLV
jgi:hypothetical protein